MPGTVLHARYKKTDQLLVLPELLRPGSHLEDGVVCPRFPEGSSQGSQGGLSEQEQGVGQGAGFGLCFPRVCAARGAPCPAHYLPPGKSPGDPRPAGLPHPGCAQARLPSLLLLPSSWAQPSSPRRPQNGNQENPSCCGIDGILEAYHHSLRTVQLYGPTNFAPVVTHVAR